MTQDYLDKLKQSIIQNIDSLEDEIINLQYIAIKNLQDKNAILKIGYEKIENIVTILESNHNDLAQYGRHNNAVSSRIPENVPDNDLENIVLSVMLDIDVKVEPRDNEECHRNGKPTSKTQKKIVRYVKRKKL